MKSTNHLPLNIANGGTVSNAIDVRDGCITGFIIPLDFAGTAVTVEVQNGPSLNNNTWLPLYIGSTLYSLTVAAGRAVMLPTSDVDAFKGITRIRATAGTAQTADMRLFAIVVER